jgi:hypothetical protein
VAPAATSVPSSALWMRTLTNRARGAVERFATYAATGPEVSRLLEEESLLPMARTLWGLTGALR